MASDVRPFIRDCRLPVTAMQVPPGSSRAVRRRLAPVGFHEDVIRDAHRWERLSLA